MARDSHLSSRRLSTLLGVCMGLCLASKESVRYTAVWYFDVKSVVTLVSILAFCVLVFAAFAFALRAGVLNAKRGGYIAIALTLFETAGLIVHAFEHAGANLPGWISLIAWLGKDGSLLLLALYASQLCMLEKEDVVRCLGGMAVIAGSIQIVLCFVETNVARPIICLLPLAALIVFLYMFKSVGRKSLELPYHRELPVKSANVHSDVGNTTSVPKDLIGACGWIFLLSMLLMCAYSNWRTQQDGSMVSLLIQLTSGVGLLMGGVILWATRRFLEERETFLACRDIVFPVALAAVYLSTLFSGSGISLPVLLFDMAYAFILAIICLQPLLGTGRIAPLIWTCAGLLAYKTGWFVGVLTTTTLQVAWIGTAVATLSLVSLVIIMTIHLATRSKNHAARQESTQPRDLFALACEDVREAYGLTTREMDVFTLLARGRTAGYIQKALAISDGTARTHISHIYRKLGIKSQQMLLDVLEETMCRLENGSSKDPCALSEQSKPII